MDLIIKPTELCNFHCTFCSSSNITDNKKAQLSLDRVREFLDRYPATNNIIVNGGDPLVVHPSYYWELIKILDDRGSEAGINLTTNLWDFKLKPDKWTPLFKEERIHVGTSFHYGNSRLITPTRVFTEVEFLEISDMMLDRIGYRPEFISVIDDTNYDRAIDNVILAKRLGVVCKLNKVLASGRAEETISISMMYEVYLKIIELGLAPWEWNSQQLLAVETGSHTTCPIARNCDDGIRALHPDGEYYSCGAFGDDGLYPIDFKEEVINVGAKQTPLRADLFIQSMKDECYSCSLFTHCNGCKKNVHDLKKHNLVESHCNQMKSLQGAIKNAPDLKALEG